MCLLGTSAPSHENPGRVKERKGIVCTKYLLHRSGAVLKGRMIALLPQWVWESYSAGNNYNKVVNKVVDCLVQFFFLHVQCTTTYRRTTEGQEVLP